MPAETFHGHGLRKDLAEKLEQMHPSFLRFPGGCIVEGFTLETAMFFCNTVGPVWERPSHWLLLALSNYKWSGIPWVSAVMWGFKAFLLFYVCNCGMTCQGRGPYYFNEAQMQFAINDTLKCLRICTWFKPNTLGQSACKKWVIQNRFSLKISRDWQWK